MSHTDDLERGRLAREVLDNPVYQDAWTQIRGEIVERWQEEKDESRREWLWNLMQSSKRLEAVFREAMNTGKLAEADLRRRETLAERAGNTLRRAFR